MRPVALVTGGQGQLARAIQQTWRDHDLVLLGREGLDLGDPDAIRGALRIHRPHVVVNAGAHTQVDRCETEPELAQRLNADAVAVLTEGCAELGALLVQISTDYVFDGQGTRPYREDDPTGPQSVYGRTKLAGEVAARTAPQHLIVRTSWLYDAWGKNFLRTMLNFARQGRALRVVDDQRGTPTSCRVLARQLEGAVREGWRGTVHATCSGETTWYGFARSIFDRAGLHPELSPCTTADYPTPARRPAYSVLDGSRRAALGTDLMPSWESALSEVLPEALAIP